MGRLPFRTFVERALEHICRLGHSSGRNAKALTPKEKAAYEKSQVAQWIKEAEGKGFEPSTGFPAPDFESGS